jgi:hypothetical protein
MIDIQSKIHDQFTVEFKVGYIAESNTRESDFIMNSWIFIPDSLDINRRTYSKEMFYHDARSHMRLITPVYELHQLTQPGNLPYQILSDSCTQAVDDPTSDHLDDFESQTKMYASIYKSAIRDAYKSCVADDGKTDLPVYCSSLIADVRTILSQFRLLGEKVNKPVVTSASEYYRYADEFISNVTEQHLFLLTEYLEQNKPDVWSDIKTPMFALLDDELAYKKSRHYRYVDSNDADNNRHFMHHASLLKKFAESNLYLSARKRHNTFFIEQMAFMLAAGIAMTFATVIAFSFQQTYGNFTLPLFIALVVSYMFKDRMKELIRYYFAHRLGSKFYDYKITMSIHNTILGWCKEGFDYITAGKLPQHVIEKRSRVATLEAKRGTDEQIILYRKKVHLSPKPLSQLSPYPFIGINDIIRFNMLEFMRKMDNPEVPVFANIGKGNYKNVNARKIYYINFVIQCRYQGVTSQYYRYRIMIGRNGVERIESEPPTPKGANND